MKHDMNELRTRVGVLGREVAKVAVGSPQATPVRGLPSAVMNTETPQSSTASIEPARLRSTEPKPLAVEEKEPLVQRKSSEAPVLPPAAPVEQVNVEQKVILPSTTMETPPAPAPAPIERTTKAKGRALPAKPTQPARKDPEEENPEVSHSMVSTYTARTKLPYPSGDYTSQPTSPTSPPVSPRNSINRSHQQQRSIAGLPRSGSPFEGRESPSPVPSGLPMAPPTRPLATRTGSSSPTPAPRKRYTVALGKPITSPPASETGSTNSFGTQLEKAFSRNAPDLGLGVLAGGEQGGSKGKKKMAVIDQGDSTSAHPTPRRPRPQSTYGGVTSSSPSLGPTAPLRPRIRSKSTDRLAWEEMNRRRERILTLTGNETGIRPLFREHLSPQAVRSSPSTSWSGSSMVVFEPSCFSSFNCLILFSFLEFLSLQARLFDDLDDLHDCLRIHSYIQHTYITITICVHGLPMTNCSLILH